MKVKGWGGNGMPSYYLKLREILSSFRSRFLPFNLSAPTRTTKEQREKKKKERQEAAFSMEDLMGLLKIRVRRGINLIVCDTVSSDPYVVVTLGKQRVKTRVQKKTCNPVWNDELTLSIMDPNDPIILSVYDKDTFSGDDKMGDAVIDIKPYIECMKMGLENLPNGTKVDRVQPNRENCLADESCIIWNNGKMLQDMLLRLRKVERGEIEVQIEWIDLPGRKSFEC